MSFAKQLQITPNQTFFSENVRILWKKNIRNDFLKKMQFL